MSVQMAMMAGAMALSAYSAAKQGEAAGAGAEGQAAGQRVQGAQLQMQASGKQLQAANEELSRRRGLQQLLAANRGQVAGKGVDGGDPGSSAGVIEDHNRASAEEDIRNIRFMGEHEKKMLDFGADSSFSNARQLNSMADQYRTIGYITAASKLMMGGYSAMGGMGGGSEAFQGTAEGASQYGSPGYAGSMRYGGPR